MPKPTPQERRQKKVKWHKCPVPGCPGFAKSPIVMCCHLACRHPQDIIGIPEEAVPEEGSAPLPRCPKCQMHVSCKALNSFHPGSLMCKRGQELVERRALEVQLHEASNIVITANGAPMEKVDIF
jgi:hypothetical protein